MKPVLYLPGTPEQYPNYLRAVNAAGGAVCFCGDPDECDALLLPGGGDLDPRCYGQRNHACRNLDAERDRKEFALLDYFLCRKKPVLGICRGLQVINVFFGGTLVQDLPGHHAVSGIDRLHTVYTAPSPFGNFCDSRCIVNSAHHQAADRLGSGLSAVQWTPDGIVEAVCHEALPVWGLQWHPERLNSGAGERVFQRFLEICGSV